MAKAVTYIVTLGFGCCTLVRRLARKPGLPAATAIHRRRGPCPRSPPPQLEDVGFKQRLDEILPLDAAFRDDNGRAVTLGELLLYCFHYDPDSGRYGLVVMNLVRLGGVMTVLFMGVILMMRRRELRPPASSRGPHRARLRDGVANRA